MKIEIYGTGCPKCKALTETAKKAVDELELKAEIEKIEDINKIVEAGIMGTPALAIDGEVKFSGKTPSVEELKKIISGEDDASSNNGECCSCGGKC